MKRIKVYLLLVILTLSFSIIEDVLSREKEIKKESMVAEIVVDNEDAGKTFKAIQGNTILIRLKENSSTGYQWVIDLSDDRVISLKKTDYIPGTKKRIGSGGTRIYQLTAESSGSAKIILKLKNKWNPDGSVIDQFKVEVKVESE